MTVEAMRKWIDDGHEMCIRDRVSGDSAGPICVEGHTGHCSGSSRRMAATSHSAYTQRALARRSKTARMSRTAAITIPPAMDCESKRSTACFILFQLLSRFFQHAHEFIDILRRKLPTLHHGAHHAYGLSVEKFVHKPAGLLKPRLISVDQRLSLIHI